MARAEYSERHYELAINIELVRRSNLYYVPSQNEEGALGYDIALVPALPPLWRSLTEGLSGVGRTAEPRLARATSLFLQYKLPEYVSNRNGGQTKARETALAAAAVPYYRFKMPKEQLRVLLDLQASFAGRAAVCYAAGLFHRRGAFYRHKAALEVAGNSIFLRLEDVESGLVAGGFDPAALTGDHCWTYDESGGRGLLCSEPWRIEGSSLRGLTEGLRGPAAAAEPLERHVDSLTKELNLWRGRWEPEVRRGRLPLREEKGPWAFKQAPQIEEPSEAVRTQQFLDSLGIGWFLAVPARGRVVEGGL
jgi:hypothetical protein